MSQIDWKPCPPDEAYYRRRGTVDVEEGDLLVVRVWPGGRAARLVMERDGLGLIPAHVQEDDFTQQIADYVLKTSRPKPRLVKR